MSGGTGIAELNQLRGQVRHIETARRRRAVDRKEAGSHQTPPAAPVVAHHDSGGGARQFRSEGDNSIQEFGKEAPASERKRAAVALHEYLDARAARRWKAACFYLSAGTVVTLERAVAIAHPSLEGEGCPNLLGALAQGADPKALTGAAEINVGSLRVEGERGFVLYHGTGGAGYAIPMVREAGEWKVGSLDGTALP